MARCRAGSNGAADQAYRMLKGEANKIRGTSRVRAMRSDAGRGFPAYRPDLTDLGTGYLGADQRRRAARRRLWAVQGFRRVYAGAAGQLPRVLLRAPLGWIDRGVRRHGRRGSICSTIRRLLWADVSKGGAAYGALTSDKNWKFAQFNEFVLAAQINTVPQKYVLTAGPTFVDLGGSPPQAGQVAIVNRFVMLTELLSNPRRAQWSDLDAPETWTAGVGLADFQDFPDGGVCHAISGGDAYGVVFQDEAIRSLTYAPGSAVTFQIARISTQDTLFAEYSSSTPERGRFSLGAGVQGHCRGRGAVRRSGKSTSTVLFRGRGSEQPATGASALPIRRLRASAGHINRRRAMPGYSTKSCGSIGRSRIGRGRSCRCRGSISAIWRGRA
jgi:hypothetical protein